MSETVRVATMRDFEAVRDLLILARQEGFESPLDAERRDRVIRHCLDPDKGGATAVACQDGRIVGTVGLTLGQPIWDSAQWWLIAVWIFVHPDYRVSRHSRNLIQQAQLAAQQVTEGRLYFQLDSPERNAGKAKLMARHFKQVGQVFIGGVA